MRLLFRIGLIFMFVAAVLAIASYVEIPYNVNTKGIIMPLREWSLVRLPDGTLINNERNNLTNNITYFSVLEFQRGDHAEFIFNNSAISGKKISKGDTVGHIKSYEEERRLLGLQTGLEEQKGLLQVSLTGQKQEEIEAARARLSLAQQEYETQKKLVDRMESLHHSGVIADEAWELAINEYNVKKQNINIARAMLDMVSTGAKQEERDLIRTSISSYERQIRQTENRINAFNVQAPFDGTIIREQRPELNGNTIIRIADMESVVVTLPVDLYQLAYIENGTMVNLRFNSGRRYFSGKIVDTDNTVQFIDQRQKVFLTALVEGNPGNFMPNMLVQAQITCGRISVLNYLGRMFHMVFEN